MLSPAASTLLFFTDPPPTEIYTLSLHDALPICRQAEARQRQRRHNRGDHRSKMSRLPFLPRCGHIPRLFWCDSMACRDDATARSEEHTSELQSRLHLVCRLLLEKKKKQ